MTINLFFLTKHNVPKILTYSQNEVDLSPNLVSVVENKPRLNVLL